MLHFVLMGTAMLMASNVPIRRRVRQLGLAQPPLDTGGHNRPAAGRRPSHASQGPHRCFDRSLTHAAPPLARLRVASAPSARSQERRARRFSHSPHRLSPGGAHRPRPRLRARRGRRRAAGRRSRRTRPRAHDRRRRPRHRGPGHRQARHTRCRAGHRTLARGPCPGRRATAAPAGRVAAGRHPAGRRAGHGRRGRHRRRPSRSCSTPRPISIGTRRCCKANAGSRKARDDAQARRDVARDRVAAARQRARATRRGRGAAEGGRPPGRDRGGSRPRRGRRRADCDLRRRPSTTRR